jgi:sporulation protein YlmC with PRC-barrel domain
MSEPIDLGLRLLDHQLVDCQGRRCGKVDDLAIEGGAGETPEVVAILAGPGVWPQSAGWIGRVAAAVARGGRVRIPWAEVEDVGPQVTLRRTAQEYRLGRGDDRVRPWIARLPGANR